MQRIHPISIGGLTIAAPVILAPMTGVTDMPFRKIVRRFGCGLNVSEMIASQAMIRETRQSLQNDADRFFSVAGSWPSRDLREIATATLAGDSLPLCPCDGGKYEMSGAIVICPTHESTRH